jgi:hypothetical protein
MERLTKTYSDGTHGASDILPCGENSYDYKNLLIEKLGKYEDLEEQGRLIKLLCKVGDTLYRLVPNLYREYVEIKIAQFVINENGIYFITNKGVSWSAGEIGKTVFLTKPEAEAKLKELRGGE